MIRSNLLSDFEIYPKIWHESIQIESRRINKLKFYLGIESQYLLPDINLSILDIENRYVSQKSNRITIFGVDIWL
jgi:hypothetical protein